MSVDGFRAQRIVSVVAAVLVAISSGTNYAYSAWAPQFADQLHLTATQLNMIANGFTLGGYGFGIPLGLLVDRKGPRIGAWLGCITTGLGYYMFWSAYNSGPNQYSVTSLCLAGLMTGLGSSSGSMAAIKASAFNWPQHRGAATALPLGAFGLSAFAYTSLSGLLFPNDAGHLLWFLTVGTFTTILAGSMFLRLYPTPSGPKYTLLSDGHVRSMSVASAISPGSKTRQRSRSSFGIVSDSEELEGDKSEEEHEHESSDDLRRASSDKAEARLSRRRTRSEISCLQKPDITGLALLQNVQFWTLFALLGLLCGVGLMTINNVGNNVRTLWHHWDPTATPSRIHQSQVLHVGILSIFSFSGRLCSGFGSDYLVKYRNSTRYWSLVVSALCLSIAQIFALSIENPNQVYLLSGFTGFGYGALFGVYPAITADTFGTAGFGINWGAMGLSPVILGNMFNYIYGANLDAHSDHPEGSERVCLDGRVCYSNAYVVTLMACGIGLLWSMACVHKDHGARRLQREALASHHG